MAATLSKTASVSTSWPRRLRQLRTSASVGLSSSLSERAVKFSSGSAGRATSNTMRIFILDRPLEPAGVEVIRDERREIGGQLEMEPAGVGRRGELQLLAAQHEFSHQHADGIFTLPGPLDDGLYESRAVLAHDSYRGFTPGLAVDEDGAQIGVIEIWEIFGVELAARGVILGQRFAEPRGLGDAVAALDERGLAGDLLHQGMDVFELVEGLPAAIALPPVIGRGAEPDGEGFGEVLVGVRLRVPVGQMADEAAAVGLRHVGFGRVLFIGAAEGHLPFLSRRESIGVIDGVAALVAQKHLAPFGGSAFDLEHLAQLERLEARMREIEREADGGHAFGREPLVAQVAIGTQGHAARGELVVE